MCGWDEEKTLTAWGGQLINERDGSNNNNKARRYLALSRVCDAAMHSGLVHRINGGCAAIRETKDTSMTFEGVLQNGFLSQNFDSWFPLAYDLKPVESIFCQDRRFSLLLPMMLVLLLGLVLIKPPRMVTWFCLLSSTYWYTRLGHHHDSISSVVEGTASMMILIAFGYILYLTGPRLSWYSRKEPLKTYVYSILPFVFTIHMTEIFHYFLGINFSLTAQMQIGNSWIVFLVVGMILMISIIMLPYHIYLVHKEGLLVKFMVGYWFALVILIGVSIAFQGRYTPHLHHEFVPLLAWPLGRYRKKSTLITQALLGGIFLNGFAIYDWTPNWDETPQFPDLTPEFQSFTVTNTSITAVWTDRGKIGYSLRLNEVEVYHGTELLQVTRDELEPGKSYNFVLKYFHRNSIFHKDFSSHYIQTLSNEQYEIGGDVTYDIKN